MHTDTYTADPQHEQREVGSPAERARRVVVVEDDDRMRGLIVAMFRHLGYDVLEGADGVDLLGWLGVSIGSPSEQAADLVVADINLPDLTAIEVMAALRT